MNKKIPAALVCLAMFATMATSCGKKGYDYELPEPTITQELVDELNSKTAANPVEITFWHGFGQSATAALTPVVDAFMEKYPGIKVTTESKGGYDGLKEAMSLAIPTTDTPNVVLGYPDHFAEYITAGVQIPLEKFIDSTISGVGIEGGTSDFYESYLNEDIDIVEGHVMGLPFNKSTEVMIYNKTFFEFIGEEVPNTWEEIKTVGENIIKKMKDNSFFGNKTATNNGITLDFSGVTEENFYPMSYDSQPNFFITATKSWGGKYTEVGKSLYDGKIKFKNAESKAAVQYMKDLYEDHVLGIPAVWEETSYCSNPFKAMKTVMGVSSSAGAYNNIAAANTYKLGIKQVPYHQGGTKTVIQQGTNIAIISNSTDLQRLASWEFIKYMTGEGNVDFAMGASYSPVRKSGVASELYQELLNSTPASEKDLSIVNAAKVAASYLTDGWEMFVDPAFVGSSVVRKNVELLIPRATVGKESVDSTFDYIYSLLPDYQ